MNQNLTMNYALQNQAGQHLGFLLMVADEKQPNFGVGLIRAMPSSNELEKQQMVQALVQLQQIGELHWAFDGSKTVLTQAENKTGIAWIQGEYLYFGEFSYQMVDIMGIV